MAEHPNLNGMVAIVTGATSGIGFEAAAQLCDCGAEVVFGVRNLEKAKIYAGKIRERQPNAKIVIPDVPLDFENQASVRQFAYWYLASNKPVHILINNAGTSFMPLRYTTDDVTILVQTNYLGPYTLTRLLESKLIESRARVVSVASITHRMAYITDAESFMLKPEQGHYQHTKLGECRNKWPPPIGHTIQCAPCSGIHAPTVNTPVDMSRPKRSLSSYVCSAIVLFAYELQRRLGEFGVQSCAADPGGVNTHIWSYSRLLGNPPFTWIIETLYAPPADGAKSIVDAASMDWKVHQPQGTPPSKDLRYYAKGLFGSPLITGLDGWLDGLFNPVRNTIALTWRFLAIWHSLIDYPVRHWSHGAYASETVPVLSSGPSYSKKLAAELWDLSALIAGVDPQPTIRQIGVASSYPAGPAAVGKESSSAESDAAAL